MRRTLHEGWTVRAVGGDIPAEIAGRRIPASVPGCVHLDLLAAGLIPDPYLDQNEQAVAWVGRVDWRYETTFDWSGAGADDQIDLEALGLDTVATIELNGQELARTANMFRSYRFAVADRLVPGANQLAVTFTAGVAAAEQAEVVLGHRPYLSAHPFNALRKMACNYGWDWGPVLVTAGIWKPISLHGWRVARIAGVRPLVDVDQTTGRLNAHVDLARAGDDAQPLTMIVETAGQRVEQPVPLGQTSTEVEVEVADVRRWWPRGYGDQPLYPVNVTLAAGEVGLDHWSGQVGFRTVALDVTPDADGTPFTLRVNDTPVFARGVNWIPDDCFPSRITRGRYAARLHQALDANVNLVRVWGGGIYESDDFYEICDELGLLVWQDFLFACAAYAEEEPLRSEVVAEAREAVSRLCQHPSLVLWNGCNENIWGYHEWGWAPEVGDRTWGWGYYTELLPGIVAELDPSRPYSPGCPYSMTPDRPPNDPAHGTTHLWEVWNRLDYTAYRDARPRFASEFGWQGPPTWATLTRAIHDQPRTADSPAMLAHQKAENGQLKLANGLAPHLPPPTSFEDWHWAMSLNQARAIQLGVEHLRSLSPLCQGAVVWQLNDCWPVTSWAAVDGDGRRKPMWYALRRAFADRLLTVQPRDAGLALVAVNDSADPWSGTARLTRRGFDGDVLASLELPLDLASRSTTTVAVDDPLARPGDSASEFLLAECDGERAWWFFAEDRDAPLSGAELESAVEKTEGGYRVRVTARTLVRELALLADRLAPDAEVDELLVTLLPGESASFTVLTGAALTEADLIGPLVLRSANQLVTSPPVAAL